MKHMKTYISLRGSRMPTFQKKRRRTAPTPEMPPALDVHVRAGLDDILVRLSPENWFRLLHLWALGQEDVIVRMKGNQQETNLVLRGVSNGSLTSRIADISKPIPLGIVMSVEEARALVLKEFEEKKKR
jgi:hypothetical protein